MADLGIKGVDITRHTGASSGGVSQWVNGVNAPGEKYLAALSEVLQCSTQWLLTGKEPPQTKPISNAVFDGQLSAWDSKTPIEEDEIAVPFYTDVELAAGSGSMQVNENPGPVIRFAKSTLRKSNVPLHSAVCVKVAGSSMEPVLPDGSTVGINTDATTVTDGKIYAINHDGMLRIKRLYNLPSGGLRIASYNRDEYPDEIIENYDTKKIRIIGKVFWHSVLWD